MTQRLSMYHVWVLEDTERTDQRNPTVEAFDKIPGFQDYDWLDYVD